jgi:4-hydroxy-tetrahydrodipicolinate synthase
MLKGNNVLLVTPFLPDGSLDEKSLLQLLEHVLAQAVDGVIVMGTTGEFFSLEASEKCRVIELVAKNLKGRCRFTAGVINSGSKLSADLAAYARSMGADAVLVAPPYYLAPSAQGMIEHFSLIGIRGDVDLMVYDGGGGMDVPVSVLKKVRANTPRMRYVKLTTPSVVKIAEIHEQFGEQIGVFGGEDLLIMPELYAGVIGLTTAAGNLQPGMLSTIFQLVQKKQFVEAQRLHDRHIAPQAIATGAIRNEFIQCFKTALKLMGIIAHDTVRAPLVPLCPSRVESLRLMLQGQGLVKG